MVLQTKGVLETEYTNKRALVLGVNQQQVDTSLTGLDGLVTQVRELAMLLRARDALRGNPDSSAYLTEKAQDLANAAAQIREIISGIQVPPPPV